MPASEPDIPSLREDFDMLCAAVRDAGALSMRFFGKASRHWEKAENQPVSEADIAVNDLLRSRLHSPRPDYGWLSEETPDTSERLSRRRIWMVDPIDGTRAFIQGKPEFTVSVALVENHEPVCAAVFSPAQNEFFAALAGEGAFCNDRPVKITHRKELSHSRICGYEKMFAHKSWADEWPPLTVENRNSVAYRLALVAGGQFDAALILNPKNDWDIAAGDLLVREAGGVVCGLDGTRPTYNNPETVHKGIMAGSPDMIREFALRVKKIRHHL